MGATVDTGYLYGQLNNYVEYLRYKFKSTDTAFIAETADHNIEIDVNTSNIVKLLQIQKDNDLDNDAIKYYQLFAYNTKTKNYDIPLGDELKIGDTSGSSIDLGNIAHFEINGKSIEVKVTESGNLEFNLPIEIFTNQILDGNGGEEPY